MKHILNSKKLQFSPLRVAVHVGAWLPLAWLAWDAFNGNLTANPIQAVTQRTGRYAITLLVLSLACTPINTLFGFRQALTVRRALGLYAFLYAAIHFFMFIGVDYRFDMTLLPSAILEKRFVLVGLAALLILAILAVTSFKWWMKRLGKNWKRLHQLIYLAGVLVVLHYAWAVKGDLVSLQGDIIKPLIYASIVILLLALRIPIVRKTTSRLRARLAGRPAAAPASQPKRAGNSHG